MALLFRLPESSRIGYYEWLRRWGSTRERRSRELQQALIRLHEKYPAIGLYHIAQVIVPPIQKGPPQAGETA